MPMHVIKRGLNVPILGASTGEPINLNPPATVAYSPTEFRGVFPKLAARAGDEVKQGQVLFFNKYHPDVHFLAPVAGRVKEIRRGKKRVITDYVVEPTDSTDAVAFDQHTLEALKGIGRDAAKEQLQKGGMWPALRTRPLDLVAAPDVVPQSIVVSATETGPLMPGAAQLLPQDAKQALQAGLYVLKALTDGAVHLTVTAGDAHPALSGLDGVTAHTFKGPHPAGDPAVQVNYIDPPRGVGQVWYLKAWDAALIGRLFLEGRFPAERTYAAVGAGAANPRVVHTILGAPLADIVGETKGEVRTIRGSVLTGEAVGAERWAAFLTRGVHILPEEIDREVLGWTTPQLDKYSYFRTSFVGLIGAGKKVFDMRPMLFGGRRAMLPNRAYASVVATKDIQPEFLFRSILSGDLEDAISLGLLDLSQEEAALMTYVCPSKLEYGVALREMLDRYIKET